MNRCYESREDEREKQYDVHHVGFPWWETKVRFINGILLGWALVLIALYLNVQQGNVLGVLCAAISMAWAYFGEQLVEARKLFHCMSAMTCIGAWAAWLGGAL